MNIKALPKVSLSHKTKRRLFKHLAAVLMCLCTIPRTPSNPDNRRYTSPPRRPPSRATNYSNSSIQCYAPLTQSLQLFVFAWILQGRTPDAQHVLLIVLSVLPGHPPMPLHRLDSRAYHPYV